MRRVIIVLMSNSRKTNTSIQPQIPPPDKTSRYALIVVMIFAIGFIAIAFWNSIPQPEAPPPTATSIPTITPLPTSAVINPNATPVPYEELTQRLERSLVFIESTPRNSFAPEHGTGVILSADGLILTNAHVINFGDVSGNITVSRVIGTRLVNRQASLIGIAPCEDLALLDISGDDYAPIPMNTAPTTIGLGTEIFILGYGQSTLSSNVSIGFARGEISRMLVTFSPYKGLIEHTAELLPSDSGSPLLNRFGEMIGMNTLMDVQGRGRRASYAINQERIQLALAYLRERQAPPITYNISDDGDDTIYRLTDYFDRHCYHIPLATGEIIISAKPQESHLFRPILSVYDSQNQMITRYTELRLEQDYAQTITIPTDGTYTVVISRATTTTTGADKLGDYILIISGQ